MTAEVAGVLDSLASQVDRIDRLVEGISERRSEHGDSKLWKEQEELMRSTWAELIQVRGHLRQALNRLEKSGIAESVC
jgi:hypothetical protein